MAGDGTTKLTIIDYFIEHVEKTPDRVYLTQPMGGDNLVELTFAEVLDQAKRVANYLKSLNFPEKSQIAICSKNCAWWIIADLAIWLAGHVSVPIYPTLTEEIFAYTIEHSESKLLFIGKLDVAPWGVMKSGVPGDMITVSLPLCPEGEFSEKWDDIIKNNEAIPEIIPRTLDEMATIIYTSGSTGRPKGVMQSFKAITVSSEHFVKQNSANVDDRYLSYLPVAHGMERWVGECIPMVAGYHVYFAESLKTFVKDLQRARPTLFLSVPRLWTKFQAGVFSKFNPDVLAILFNIPLLDSYIKKKILTNLGLDSVRIAGSGSAPMPAELISWYHDLGLDLLEGYGMTENFNYSHMSIQGKGRPGYVGNANPEVEQRIAEDGEIQVKTPGCMMGYFKNEEATKETITEDGWLRTGDKGMLDEEGRLKITGRVKEIFKTSKGKYVAPAPIENKLIIHRRIELACVGGATFPQPHAVVMLSDDSRAALKADGALKATITDELKELLASVNKIVDDHEKLSFIAVISDEWTPENGFLTPTLKIKRAKIEDTYKPNNETWYNSSEKVIFHGW